MLQGVIRSSFEALRNYKRIPSELRQLQTKKMRWTLRYCYDYVPLYHEWFRKRGLTPEDVREPRDLRLLPRLSRETLSGTSPEMIVVPGARVGLVRSTSGTTGRPVRILWSPGFSDMVMGQVFRATSVEGVRPWHRVAMVWTGSPGRPIVASGAARRSAVYAYKLLFGSINLWVLVFNQVDLFVSKDNWRSVASMLHGLQPDVIYSRPTHARRLGVKLREEGQKLDPKFLIIGGEFMSDGTRADIASLYGCEVFEEYGSMELGSLGFECPEHSGMHLNSDFLVFEVERDGEEVSPGESGELVITGLHNETMPLIRYEQGDRVVLEEEGRCGCGSYLPRLRAIQGRLSDGLVAEDGTRIPPGVICDQLERVMGIRDYQLVQKSRERVILKLLSRDNAEQTAGGVSGYLTSLLGGSPTVEIEEWSEDDMPAKYRPVISEIN